MTRLVASLLLLLVAAPLSADPETTVRALLTHYAGGDLQRAAALWVDGAPRNDFMAAHRRRMNVRCARLLSLETRVVSRDETSAAIETEETFLLGDTRLERAHSRLILRHEGEWKIASWESREMLLAGRIASATAAGRAGIVEESPELHTTVLVRLLSRRAIARVNENQLADAANLAATAWTMAERLGDPAALAEALSARSVVARYGDRADPERALELAREAAALAARSGDPDALAATLLRHARANESLTGSLEADPLYPVLERAERVEDAATISMIATYVARSLNARAAVREAVRYAELASQYAEESGDAAARISASIVLGGSYTTFADDFTLALRHFRHAAAMAVQAGFESAAAFSYTSIASVQWGGAGDGEGAKRTIEEALQKLTAPSGVAGLLIQRAHLHAGAGDFAAAESDVQRALALFPADATTRFLADLVRAGIRFQQGRYGEVLELAARANPELNHDFQAMRVLEARSLHRLGRSNEALQVIERNAEHYERPHVAVLDPEQLLFTSIPNALDALWLVILLEQGNVARALEVSERGKLADMLRVSLAHASKRGHELADPEARRMERTLAARVAALNRALVAAPNADEAAAVREQLQNARADFIDFRRRAFARAPVTRVQPPTGLDLDALPPRLDAVTIVSYVPLDETTLIFVVGPKERGRRTLAARIAPIGAHALSSMVARLAVLLNERNLRADAAGTELYELLLKPVEREIRAATMLCIVPANHLWRVPFHALRPAGGKAVIERTPVFYAPSIGVLADAESKRQQRRAGTRPAVLAFANPHVNAETASLYRAFDPSAPLGALPETETEVRAIARIYGAERSSIRVGAEAREAELKRDASRYDVLHVATHGLVYERAPMFSALLLAASPDEDGDDGLLEAREIAGMRLGADLAVFSACDTGKMSAGVIGFSWALLAAGCPTTVVSQWNAQSASTAKLMIEFHRQLVAGASKPEALRRAQLHVRSDARYRHLFYWAPFVIIGAP